MWSTRLRARPRLFSRLAPLASLVLVCLAWAGPGAGLAAQDQPCIVDDLGREVCLERPARRVISLYAAFNELIGAMGLEERIVARTKADSLPGLADLPGVGTHMRPNVEQVLLLEPDLVLQLGGGKHSQAPLEQLVSFGVPVAVFNPAGLEDIFSVVSRLGVLMDAPDQAQALEQGMKKRLETVRAGLIPSDRPLTVFFEVRYPNLLAAGQASVVNDVIRLAGGMNPVSQNKRLARVSEETLLELDPDVYLIQKGPMNPLPVGLDQRPLYDSLTAARENRVLVVEEDIFSRPGPRIVDAVELLAEYLKSLKNKDVK